MVERKSFRVHEMFSGTLNEPSEEEVMRELIYHGLTFRSNPSSRTASTRSSNYSLWHSCLTILLYSVKDAVKSVMYDILLLYIYLFWFAMLVNEYKPEFFYVRKVRKMGNLGNICGLPFVMSRTDAQNGLYRIFKYFCIRRESRHISTWWNLRRLVC